jgi:hypothetical protein
LRDQIWKLKGEAVASPLPMKDWQRGRKGGRPAIANPAKR